MEKTLVTIPVPDKYQDFAKLSRNTNHWGKWLDAVESMVGYRIEREGLGFIRNAFLRGESALTSAISLQLISIRTYYDSINFEFSEEKIWDCTPEIMGMLFAGKTIEEVAESIKGKIAKPKSHSFFFYFLFGFILVFILRALG